MKIKSIKFIGKRQVYDLVMKKNHNFLLSNGITSSNSEVRGMIEGCLTGNTEIKNILGNNIQIKKLPKNFKIKSYNFNKNILENKNAKIKCIGIKPCYKIEFEDGTFIEVTKEHRFFTIGKKEIRVEKLKIGNKLLYLKNDKY